MSNKLGIEKSKKLFGNAAALGGGIYNATLEDSPGGTKISGAELLGQVPNAVGFLTAFFSIKDVVAEIKNLDAVEFEELMEHIADKCDIDKDNVEGAVNELATVMSTFGPPVEGLWKWAEKWLKKK